MMKSAVIPVTIDFSRFPVTDNTNVVLTQEDLFDGQCLLHQNNLYSPYVWEERGDPAFTGTVVISGCRFRTVKEAEKYGKKVFGEHYAGVHQVVFSDEDDLPF